MKVALEFMPPGNKRETLARDLREMENLIAVLLEREELRSRTTGRLSAQIVDLGALVTEVMGVFAEQGPGVEFVATRQATLLADPALLKLLIQNLLDNAVKFSLPDSRSVVVTLEVEPNRLNLRVADDGIGIPAGDTERLFEPFVKSDRARGHRVGYGIGLNLCRRIAELHHGTIQLLPREPRGAEALVSLPRESQAEPEGLVADRA